VVAAVPQNARARRTVADALQDHDWPTDIRGGLTFIGLFEYFQLWDLLHETVLTQDADVHLWRPETSCHFSSKSAYRAFFNGSITFRALVASLEIIGSSEV